MAGHPSLNGGKPDPDFPAPVSIRRWVADDPNLMSELARAREMGIDALLEDIPDIADDSTNDYMFGKQGLMLDTEHVSRSKLRIQSRLDMAKVLDPKRYGAKLELADSPDRPVGRRSLLDLSEADLVAAFEAAQKRSIKRGERK